MIREQAGPGPGAGSHRAAGHDSGGQPIGVYLHVPYCSSRCGYCDFNTFVPGETGRGNPAGWSSSAVAEIRLQDELGRSPGVSPGIATVFFGGGTPTLLPAADLVRVIEELDHTYGLTPDVEVTVEANPETLTEALLAELLSGGVTRLSIGMQSADARVLAGLDRQHTPGQARAAAELARSVGFDHVSLDLIYGSPNEDLGSWTDTLEEAVSAGVDHISAYALKLEAGTRLAREVAGGRVSVPDDDYAASAYETADRLLSAAGLGWYEISNWARPGSECRHNLGYWQGRNWWGIGPGAHGHWRGRRFWNLRNPARWQRQITGGSTAESGHEDLTASERLTEQVMLGIRLRTGLPARRVGLDPEHPEVVRMRAEGLLLASDEPGDLVLTRRGRLLADAVTLRLLDVLEGGRSMSA